MPVYLDNAATSFPKPERVYARLREFLERYGACPGRGSYSMAREAEGVVEETRGVLAQLFEVNEPNRIAMTLNTTDALNMAIKGLLEPNDHVVTTVMEHNSVSRPLNSFEQRGVISVTRVSASSDGFVDPYEIEQAITDKTKLVAVVHASNVTGNLQPISKIGELVRNSGRIFLVDAAQTAGSFPINVEDSCIDLLAFPGHKGLLGPPGTGGLYVGPRVTLRPWREGGTGVLSELAIQPDEFPLRLEAGSPNTLGIALLGESVRFILQYGVEWIRKNEMALTKGLLNGLLSDKRLLVYGPLELDWRVAVVSLNVIGCAPEEVAKVLEERSQVAVRTGLHCAPGAHKAIGTFPRGTIRVSPGHFNKDADIDLCLEGLKDAASTLQINRCQTLLLKGKVSDTADKAVG